MADDLSETRQLLRQAMERMEAIAPSASHSRAPYPYRPITRQVNVQDVGNRRRLSLSLNRVGNRDLQEDDQQPGPSRFPQLQPSSTSEPHRAREERRALFAGKRPKAKRPRRMETWKRCFVCLCSVGQDYVPGAVEKAELQNSGLGTKQITFFERGSSWELHEELIQAFPKLENAGGYELMRTEEGNSKDLFVIPQPVEGYTASYLKTIVQHAKIYIRPLQQDLPLDTPSPLSDSEECLEGCLVGLIGSIMTIYLQ